MDRWMTAFMLMTGIIAAVPDRAASQASVQLRLHWEWTDDGSIPRPSARALHREAYRHRGHGAYLPPREVVYLRARRAIRVPPGHRPPAGYCRLWYPGRPPGHQPPPERCGHLLRHPHPGAVILGAPAHHEEYRGPAARGGKGHEGKSWKEGKKRKKGKRRK